MICEYICSVPNDWEYENTGTNHTIMIPEDVNIEVNGQSLTSESNRVFYTADNGELQCGGYTQINGEQTYIAMMGDDGSMMKLMVSIGKHNLDSGISIHAKSIKLMHHIYRVLHLLLQMD